jgi:hypothetical protein
VFTISAYISAPIVKEGRPSITIAQAGVNSIIICDSRCTEHNYLRPPYIVICDWKDRRDRIRHFIGADQTAGDTTGLGMIGRWPKLESLFLFSR